MTLKDLSNLKYQQDRKNRPSIPEHAVVRGVFTDKTANGLTKAIQTFCALKGIFCQRTGNEGRYRPGASYVDAIGRTRIMKGTWLPGQNNGQADLTLVVNGRYVAVEVKIGKDRQSQDQKDFEKSIKASGGQYWIVRTWQEFYEKFMCRE